MKKSVSVILIFFWLFFISIYTKAEDKEWFVKEAVPRNEKIMILWTDGTVTNSPLGQDYVPVVTSKKGELGSGGEKPQILRGKETPNGYLFRIFDREIATRDNFPYAKFSLPQRNQIESAKVVITAYCDDRTWLRAVSFQLDGQGGYIGTSRTAPSQVRGNGTISPGQTKTWTYDLANTQVSAPIYGSKNVSFLDILKSKGEHTLESAVSTYMRYGPKSWLTLDLVIKYKEEGKD